MSSNKFELFELFQIMFDEFHKSEYSKSSGYGYHSFAEYYFDLAIEEYGYKTRPC